MQSSSTKDLEDISNEELQAFSSFIYDAYGLRLDWYNQSSLIRRLHRVLQLNRLTNLTQLALLMSRNKDYFWRFTDLFTVQVTELFREPLALRELKTTTFPFLERLLNPKILVVGTSSGEEVISLCIMLKEAGMLSRSQIIATDLSQKALEKAKDFAVSKTKIEHAEMNYLKAGGEQSLKAYYQATSSMCYFHKELMENVEWSLFDLTQSELGLQFDLILCKNVLIYFNHQYQSKPLSRLVRHLRPGGFMALGEKESMAFYRNENYLIQTVSSEYKIYRKSLKVL